MEFMVIYNENFFLTFKRRWLKTKELVLFLANVDMLVSKKLIKISYEISDKPQSNYTYNKTNIEL